MQIHLFFISQNFASIYVIFIIVLAITNRRFYPKKSDIRSHMYHATVKYCLAKMDQENLAFESGAMEIRISERYVVFSPIRPTL